MLNLLKKDKIKNDEWEKTVDKVKAIYYFIIGGRHGRKSTKIQLKMLKKYFKKKQNLFYFGVKSMKSFPKIGLRRTSKIY